MGVRVHVDGRVQGGPAHSAEGELAAAVLAAVLAVGGGGGGGGGGGRGASSPAQRQGQAAQVREHGRPRRFVGLTHDPCLFLC